MAETPETPSLQGAPENGRRGWHRRHLDPPANTGVGCLDGRHRSNSAKAAAWRAQSTQTVVDTLAHYHATDPRSLPTVPELAGRAGLSPNTVYRVVEQTPELRNKFQWRRPSSSDRRTVSQDDFDRALDVNSALEARIRLLEGELAESRRTIGAREEQIKRLEHDNRQLLQQRGARAGGEVISLRTRGAADLQLVKAPAAERDDGDEVDPA